MIKAVNTYRHHVRFRWLLVAIAFLSLLISLPQGSCNTQSNHMPRLVVMIIVDQMRADYLDRFASHWHGGLYRFLQDGERFTQAYHDHAITKTVVGHAVLATGQLPSGNGIIGDYLYNHITNTQLYSCEDSTAKIIGFPDAPGRSPVNILTPTLGDIAKRINAESKVVTLALKDRPAIMMGGKNPDAVYWLMSKQGKFVTSTYYAEQIPAWLDSLNSSDFIARFAGSIWELVLPESSYVNHDGLDRFPHQFAPTINPIGKDYYRDVIYTPFTDMISIDLARRLIKHYELGNDDNCDFLFVSCSSADYIGHEYGPDSPEIEDYYIRLDDMLGSFLDNLDSTIGKNNYLAVLSSDHGVMPIPEVLVTKGIPAVRYNRQMVDSVITAIADEVADHFKLGSGFLHNYTYHIVLDENMIRLVGQEVDSVENYLAEQLRMLPFIEDVYTAIELADSNTADRPYIKFYKNCFEPNRSPHLYLRFPEYTMVSSSTTGADHGSPYLYDRHVPIVFMGKGIPPGVCNDTVRTVDIVPSVLQYLGIEYDGQLDGKPIL